MMRALGLCLVAALAPACTPFRVTTPAHFVALPEPGDYDWRGATPDGMVVGVRAIDNDARGDLGFWAQALELKLRGLGGYALLDKKDIEGKGGLRGVRMRFGHDEGAKPHLYDVVLYVTQKRLFLLEAGAAKDVFERYAADVEGWLASFQPT
jgi:hypothetical protein